MPSGYVIRKNQYYDSVFLMGVNKRISQVEGVEQTAVLMGSEKNKAVLADLGITGSQFESAQPSDLIAAVVAPTQEIVETVLNGLDDALSAVDDGGSTSQVHTLEDGLSAKPLANLAVLSIPGEYVYQEAKRALEADLNLFIFSSNVSIEEELKLKRLASERNLLVMGPDCGTSILGGKGIGFANAVRKGTIGAIGPSGTGLQEFTIQVHNSGYGISHAIGTGSRDLSGEIGAISTLLALEILEEDPQTEIIAIIAKPPDQKVLDQVLERAGRCTKPVIGCFLGKSDLKSIERESFHGARIIDEAVSTAVGIASGIEDHQEIGLTKQEKEFAQKQRRSWSSEQRFLRGLFAGGTFCYQTQQILAEAGQTVFSNAPLDPRLKLVHSEPSREHTLIDMGDEEYTLGRPHPMIDGTVRHQRILSEGHDPAVAVILLDFVLGYNASTDPVGELLDAILVVKQTREEQGGDLTVVASICGTENDPQDLVLQREMLENAGVIVFQSNAKAALFCAELLNNS
ncbi:MAG TPA: acyl-CoA synthetase FdrA [candidate division Zixibacteria bacterium]|nr:acyl-CoA synthetase FdrA [candidate division Zixibacteria bacterium]